MSDRVAVMKDGRDRADRHGVDVYDSPESPSWPGSSAGRTSSSRRDRVLDGDGVRVPRRVRYPRRSGSVPASQRRRRASVPQRGACARSRCGSRCATGRRRRVRHRHTAGVSRTWAQPALVIHPHAEWTELLARPRRQPPTAQPDSPVRARGATPSGSSPRTDRHHRLTNSSWRRDDTATPHPRSRSRGMKSSPAAPCSRLRRRSARPRARRLRRAACADSSGRREIGTSSTSTPGASTTTPGC